jgi:hypothetical protein
MTKEETFYVEEYKSLRQEMTTKLKDRLEFNRWGLIGLAALYSYIFSNPGTLIMFWVPVGLSLVMIIHLNEEHRMVYKAADYIKTETERWADGGAQPQGWENFLRPPRAPPTPRWWTFWKRWPWHLWDWSPVPLWIALFGLTLFIALGTSLGLWPSLSAPPP